MTVNNWKTLSFLHAAFFTRRGLLILAGIMVFAYAVIILLYVQSIPDLGIRSAFSTVINSQPRPYEGEIPQKGDVVYRVGDIPINHWADLLNAPFRLRDRLEASVSPEQKAKEMEQMGAKEVSDASGNKVL